MNSQKVFLSELNDEGNTGGRKASRIELRTLRDAYNLKPLTSPTPIVHDEPECELKRVTAYCTAESYNLMGLCKLFKEKVSTEKKVQMYFEECLYISFEIEEKRIAYLYFLHYGAVVMWGLSESEEQDILRLISHFQENPYDRKAIETENFMYGISKNSQIVNDKIFLRDENIHTKMVLSIAMAQSVKLDYYEELVDNTIDAVKGLPDEVEKEGKVGKKREDIMKVTGKLHKLSFNLNIVSNILGEPEFVWEYSAFSSLYETCIKYLDIKTRANLLNKRCEIIHGILEILSDNVTTQNSERLESNMAKISYITAATGIIQCFLLCIFLYYTLVLKK
ncbi:uncharacterized protein VICG_01402 [Vittaforma corneae ATCC 50505]|uniref:DUF155 domain-containing protein n=1 Tax=Vittaforma corneae (strain ATCC 50505) TaxID=993615 RepID=L2GKX7_VITCO|nr:uncharacterized protein VICG_01402 [Vittaforma corneae ATCC 50505]ELA41538.1 hypothetical protein VICG_01402 [Vittaforma corneae ATCC 50505]